MQYFQRFEKEARESLSKNQPILVARSATGETRYCTPITISNKPPGSIKQRNEARSTSDPPFSNLSTGMWEGGRVISCRISRNVK